MIHKTTRELFTYYTDLINETRGKLFSDIGYDKGEEGLWYYKPYFSKFDTIDEKFITRKKQEAYEIIKKLSLIQEEIKTLQQCNAQQHKILQEAIQYHIWTLEYHTHTIHIEAEKAGFKQDSKQISFHYQKEKAIETLLYGKNITELPQRSKQVAQKLHQLSIKGRKNLNTDDQHFWKIHLNPKIQSLLSSTDTYKKESEQSNEKDLFINESTLFLLVNLALQIEGFDKDDIVNIEMKEDIKEPFIKDKRYYIPTSWQDAQWEEYLTKQGEGKKFKVLKQVRGSGNVYIKKNKGENFIHNYIKLPAPIHWKHNLTNRILPVILDHEISTHIKTWMGNANNYNISTIHSEDFEEGVALVNQHLATHNTLESFYEAPIADICQFLGETFDDEEFQNALHILYKLNPSYTLTPEERFRRTRIGVPLWMKGAKRRDMTYGKWIEYIRQLEQLATTEHWIEQIQTYAKVKYGSKISFEEVAYIDKILENIWSLREMKVDFPLFVGIILYQKLFKTPKRDIDKIIANDPRHFITQKKATTKQKKLLEKMLTIIQESL